MNLSNKIPTELALDLLERSICAVQVSAVVADSHGIFAWGWNHSGDGYGCHAEAHAISRANPNRLYGSTIYVAAKRYRNSKIVMARPCSDCMTHLNGMVIWWRDKTGAWVR